MNYKLTSILLALSSLLVLEAGCKRKEAPKVPVFNKGASIEATPGQSPANGTAIVAAAVDTAAEALHASIVGELKAKDAKFENQTWFESRGRIEGDWIAYSPKNYWKKDLSTLPAGFACKAGDLGCDMQFERKLCTTDLECKATNTQCLPLQASVSKEGLPVRSMCLGSGDMMMDDYYLTVVKAQRHLEISSLTVPSGRFRKALINGLSVLSHRATPPTIRMLFSSLDGITPNFINPPDKVLDAILKEILAVGGKPDLLPINLGFISDKKKSWNHTKILLADSQFVLQGGHNFLDPDYVKDTPIFDLSMHASGSVGKGVQSFINLLWTEATPSTSTLKNGAMIVPPTIADSKDGATRIIGMGRMGDLGNLASDDGFIALLNASKKSVYFAQQDLFNDIVKLGAKPSHALPALIDAIFRGVTIKVVQSSSTVLLGYGMVAPEKARALLTEAIVKEATARKFVPKNGASLSEYLCQQIEYAPLLFNAALTKWPNGDAIGVHPKLIIVDEIGFYLGSQNFYPSDLQEFGLFVSDTKVTGELLANYWNKIWEESKQKKVACP